jgi:protein-tyrosine phosphatase
MIDIHHHLLPGLDDGARTLDISLGMVEMAIADGITHIVCTPHASHHYYFNPERNATAFAQATTICWSSSRTVPFRLTPRRPSISSRSPA